MDKFFKLQENGTKVSRDYCRIDHVFAMSYIIFVNRPYSHRPVCLGGCVSATIIASVIGTLVMVFCQCTHAQAPGMGLNAFFLYRLLCLG